MNPVAETVYVFLITAAFATVLLLAGCDRRETILDVDTPDGGVSVERDIDDGSIRVDVDE